MKKQLIIIGIIILLLIVGFSGCNEQSSDGNINNGGITSPKSDEEKIIGKWSYSIYIDKDIITDSYMFLSNKTLKVTNTLKTEDSTTNDTINGTWNITDNKLLITLEGQDTIIYDYKFSSDNTKLRIADSSKNILDFVKQ